MKHSRTTKSVAIAGVALSAMVGLTACGGNEPLAADELDLSDMNLTAEQEKTLTDLYDAAIESGKTDVTIYAGHHDEVLDLYADFEKHFPGLTVVPDTLVGAELQTALEAEKDTGQHNADVITNPNADRYADQGFAEKYTPATFAMPEWAGDRIAPDQFEDPDGFYYSPWAFLFSAGFNGENMTVDEMPANWPEFIDEQYAGDVTLMTPATPGGTQTVLSLLLHDGIVDEDWLRTLAEQSHIVAQDQLALQSVASGEYAIDLSSSASSILKSQNEGSPLELHWVENPVIATDKWMVAADAPNPDAAKLFMEYLFTAPAQEQSLAVGNFPLTPAEGLESPHDWPSLEDIDFVPLPSQATVREEVEKNQDLFLEITGD